MLSRSKYECDCAAYYRSGWICSHVLAVQGLLKDVNLKIALTQVAVRKTVGRPRKAPDSLTNDGCARPSLSVTNLVNKLQRNPMHCFGWRVLVEFEYADDDDEAMVVVEAVPGTIQNYVDHKERKTGLFVRTWKVKFHDGDIIAYDLQNLVDMIRFAALSGLDVSPTSDIAVDGTA